MDVIHDKRQLDIEHWLATTMRDIAERDLIAYEEMLENVRFTGAHRALITLLRDDASERLLLWRSRLNRLEQLHVTEPLLPGQVSRIRQV